MIAKINSHLEPEPKKKIFTDPHFYKKLGLVFLWNSMNGPMIDALGSHIMQWNGPCFVLRMESFANFIADFMLLEIRAHMFLC